MGESLVAGEAEDRSARRSACFPKDGDLPEPPERSGDPPGCSLLSAQSDGRQRVTSHCQGAP